MSGLHADFSGRRALVTGGTKGIGRATALLFAELGADVVATYHTDEQSAGRLRTDLEATPGGERAHLVERCDLGDHDALRSLVARLDDDGHLPDILVCNAAFQRKALVAETDVALMEETFRANVFGNYVLVREVCDRLVRDAREGAVVVNSSNQAEFVNPTGFAYALSKAALNHMVRHLARAYVVAGIRVNGLVLGWFDTEGERAFYSAEQIARQAAQNIPAGRAGEPAEAARMVAVLASPLSSYATGSLVRLDGGFALAPDVST